MDNDFDFNKNNDNGTGEPTGLTPTPPLPPTPPVPPKEDTETVVVSKNDLAELLKRVDKVEAENKKLTEIADKGRLAHWESTHKGAVAKTYHLSTYQDKVVVGWSMTENRVWKDPEGKWREKQDIALALEDGEKVVLPYVEFISNTNRIEATLVSTESKGEKTYLTVETKDKDGKPKTFTIDSVFIN